VREGIFAFRAWKLDPRTWPRKKVVLIGGAGLAIVLAACLALGPIVRARAAAAARQRGMTVEIGSVWPAFGGVKLKDVRVRAGQPEWMSGELPSVRIGLGLTFGVRSIAVRGGKIALSGSVDEVMERARALTKSREEDKAPAAGGPGPELSIEDIGLSWAGPFDRLSAFEIDHASAERARSTGQAEKGFVKVGAIRVRRGGMSAKAHGLVARFSRSGGSTRWSEANLEGLAFD